MQSESPSLLAKGTLTNWVGVTTVIALAGGVRQVWLPDWHHPERIPSVAADVAEVAIAQPGPAPAEAHLRQALAELAAFFAGERRTFTVKLDPQGTEFFRAVWAEVAAVPYGTTRTYLDIAKALGAPDAVRAVGTANGANPVAPFVPCHRIVGSDGTLTGYGPGLPLKQRLLRMENALPASTETVAQWSARVSLDAAVVYVGVRASGVVCHPSCTRLTRHADRVYPLFTSLADAVAVGLHPCPTCQPDKPAPLEMGRLF